MLTIIYVVCSMLFIMLFVVGTHEFGHYIAAKYFGVGIKSVVMGLGKPFYSKTLKSGLTLSVTPLPLGGYVKLFNEREVPLSKSQMPFSLTQQPAWRRIVILLAGAVVNFLVAFMIFSSLFFCGNRQIQPVLAQLEPNSITYNSGVQPGDIIKSINGWQTPNWSLAVLAILSHSGSRQPLTIFVQRNSHFLSLKLTMDNWRFNGLRQTPLESLGISLPAKPKYEFVHYNLLESLQKGAYQTWQYAALNSILLSKIVTRKISIAALAGPLALLDAAQSTLKMSVSKFMTFIALLSIAVAIVNLLPLPSLDGGHIMYVLLEKIRGRPVSVAMEVLIYRFMLAALFVFFMQLIANDLDRLAQSSKAKVKQTVIN